MINRACAIGVDLNRLGKFHFLPGLCRRDG
jgi:hypothetical protein